MQIDQRHYDREPTSRKEQIIILVVSAAFLFMMAMEIFSNYEPRKLGALFFVLFWIPLLYLHEFGHAMMAKILGWQVQRIVIGFGKVFTTLSLFGAPVEIRAVPLEGFVQIAPKTIQLARFKHALIYFAGPGIELLLFFIIALKFGSVSELFTLSDHYSTIALQSLAYAALAGAIINLIPIGIITKDGSTPNDGMGILLSLFATELDYKLWIEEAKKSKN